MAREPPMCCHACPTHWCVVVVARERTNAWRHVVCLSEPGFRTRGRSGRGAPDGGSPTEVEVVVGKVHRKIFRVAARCFDSGGRFRSFL